MRVHITDVQVGDRIAEDIFNSLGLHVLSKGAVINERAISQLYLHQVDYIKIEIRPAESAATAASNSIVDKEVLFDAFNPLLKPLYHEAVAGAELIFERALIEGRIYEDDVQESFQPLVDNFRAERDVVSLLLLLNNQDDYTYQHSVQVGMLSYYIARWLHWPEEETVRAGKAGFLHDIGKCQIPEAILNKPHKLTEDEFEEIKNHPKLGFDILKRSFDDPTIALAALQHHERMDGRGYPSGLTKEEIHPLAKVVAVADVYSAMISSRVYREKRGLLHVLKVMYELSFKELDPVITQTFIRQMIPNFIGKKVELTTGETGIFIMSHPTEFFRPLIQVGDHFIDLAINRNQEIQEVFM
jgi:putative nucleotidyltransferase with HDIG domain